MITYLNNAVSEYVMIETRDLVYVIDAHTNKAKKPVNSTRMWDKITPYYMHPLWCATMILHETSLLEELRINGSQALLYHDVLEDTMAELPEWLLERIKDLVHGMTFKSSEDEWENLWKRDKEVRLLKMYDKTSNLLDGVWIKPERKIQHINHLRKLSSDIRGNYGNLNIIRIARTLI